MVNKLKDKYTLEVMATRFIFLTFMSLNTDPSYGHKRNFFDGLQKKSNSREMKSSVRHSEDNYTSS